MFLQASNKEVSPSLYVEPLRNARLTDHPIEPFEENLMKLGSFDDRDIKTYLNDLFQIIAPAY